MHDAIRVRRAAAAAWPPSYEIGDYTVQCEPYDVIHKAVKLMQKEVING
jgi:hypothetical protein